MNKILILVIGAMLIYIAASGRLEKVWAAITEPLA